MPSATDHRGPGDIRDGGDNGDSNVSQPAKAPRSKLTPVVILMIVGSVALPVVFWQSTWFGSALSDERLAEYLAATAAPRHTQHALVQMSERMDRGDPNASTYYPQVAALATHERPEIRATAAWVMGRDSRAPAFHEALRRLVDDPIPLVQRNAALALSNFDDPAARPLVLAMLESFTVTSPAAGTIDGLLPKGRPVRAHMDLATIQTPEGREIRLSSPVGGEVRQLVVSNGATVTEGQAVCTLGPADEDRWEALRALVRVGAPEDVPAIREAVNRYRASERVAKQAELTCEAIEKRAAAAVGR